MVLDFKYSKKGEVSNRTIFLLQEDDGHYYGLDKQYLDEDQWKNLNETLKEYKVTGRTKDPIEGFNSDWNKAWRCFIKSSIVPEEEKEEEN